MHSGVDLDVLRQNPEPAFFLTLGCGCLVGRVKLGSQPIGAVLGALFAGLLVGQVGITIGDEVTWMFFTSVLFAIGFTCGLQFVRGCRRAAPCRSV